MTGRKPNPGDLDAISESGPGPFLVWDYGMSGGEWVIDSLMPHPSQAGTHRDCPACTCPRGRHDGWGCACGCPVAVALITGRPS